MYYSVSPAEATILNCNETFLCTLGYAREEVIGKPIFTFMDESVRDFAYENFKKFLETGSVKNKEYIILKKNGEKIFVSLNAEAVRDQDNKILYSISSWRDITDQKAAEQKLKNSNELLSLFIQLSPIYAYIKAVTSTDSRILYASDNYVNMVGIRGSDMIGKSVLDVFPENFAREILKEDCSVVLNNEILRIEQHFNNRIYSTVKFPIKQDGKNLLAGYSIDITDIVNYSRTIQEQNTELQKVNTDKDIFISILAHDLKNPFNALMGFSTLLVENVRKYSIERIEAQLKLINENSRRAYNLLEDILFWTQAQSGKIPFEPTKVNFREICAEAVDNIQLSAINKNIRVEIDIQEIQLVADKNMLTTIMRNLLTNAIKFTNNEGNIIITAVISGEYAVVSVIDDGIGMNKRHVGELFDFTRKVTTPGTVGEAGTGFGLLLCKEFVGKHGGKIWVESELNKGSAFRFTIPVWLNAATA
jgi:PAS domain S-box-containing protein